jgi:hypothetical protein
MCITNISTFSLQLQSHLMQNIGRVGRLAISRSKSSRLTLACTNLSLYMLRKVLHRATSGKQLREDQMSRNYSSTVVAVPSLVFDGWLAYGGKSQFQVETTQQNRRKHTTTDATQSIVTNKGCQLKQCKTDPCIFYRRDDDGKVVLLMAEYIDDEILAGKRYAIEDVKRGLREHLTISDLGPLRRHLGVYYSKGMEDEGPYYETEMRDFVIDTDSGSLRGYYWKTSDGASKSWISIHRSVEERGRDCESG